MEASERSACIATLAALLRSTVGVHAALIEWHRHVPADAAEPLERVAGRVPLCRLPEEALAALDGSFGDERGALDAVFAVYRSEGGDVAGMVDAVAAALARNTAMEDAGRAAAAGARASGRIVAFLPLAFLALSPVVGGARFDVVGLALLTVGAALAASGLRWIEHLVPRAPMNPNAGEAIAELAASMLRGGSELGPALRAIARHGPRYVADPLISADRMVTLGASWPAALARSTDESLRALAPVVDRSLSMGLPVSGALAEFAESTRAARERAFEARLRAAPVRMVLPLALCLLPAFFLLALGPFIRNML